LIYVIDSSALEELARRNPNATRIFGEAIDQGICYITPPTLATAYYAIWEAEGEKAAETWLDFAMDREVMRIEERSDKDFLRLVAKARTITALSLGSRYAAALARILDAEVITKRAAFEDLANAGFCRVRWI